MYLAYDRAVQAIRHKDSFLDFFKYLRNRAKVSRINEMAEKIGGQIIQMSMSCWVKEVAINLNKKAGFKHKILKMSDEESIEWVRTQMKSVNLKDFI